MEKLILSNGFILLFKVCFLIGGIYFFSIVKKEKNKMEKALFFIVVILMFTVIFVMPDVSINKYASVNCQYNTAYLNNSVYNITSEFGNNAHFEDFIPECESEMYNISDQIYFFEDGSFIMESGLTGCYQEYGCTKD